MRLSGFFLINPLARWVWIASERYGFPLPGRLAPIVVGLMLGRVPHRVRASPSSGDDLTSQKERP